MKKTIRKGWAFLIVLAFLLQTALFAPAMSMTAYAETEETVVSEEVFDDIGDVELDIDEFQESAEPLEAEATNRTILAFTSDTHNKSGNDAVTRLGKWLDYMEDLYGQKVDIMSFGGDMAGAGVSGYWDYTQADINMVAQKGVTGVYTTGNHEISYGGDFSYNTYIANGYSSTETKGQFEIDKEVEVGSNYRIYCLGSQEGSESSGSRAGYANRETSLEEYLDSVGNDKAIFIITHFPLHHYGSRTTTNASKIIDVLNDAVENGTPNNPLDDKTIIFLWGHNHTLSDTYYDMIYGPGGVDSIQYGNSSSESKTIKFYYGGAGCMSDSENGGGSAFVKGKGLVVEITENDGTAALNFKYHNATGDNVTESESIKTVEFTPPEPVPVNEVIIDEVVPTVELRRNLQLNLTIDPENATVAKKEWSSSDETVATVNKNGLVTGVGIGTARITVTVTDTSNSRGVKSAYVDIEVVPRSTSGPMYIRTNTLEVDKNYIIANKNDGEAYALTNNNGSVGKTSVTIDGDTIYLDEENEDIVFTTAGSGTTVTSIGNNGRYLSAGNSSLSLATSAPSNRTFAYGTDNKLTVKGSGSSSNTYYIYYSTYNNGNYSASTSATSSSSPREVYLFEEVTELIPVDSVTVTPGETTIQARTTVPLSATVLPENATSKKVTWTSSDSSIASVDDDGVVRGRNEGDVTITAEAGGKRGTATIHVIPNENPLPSYVITIDGYALSSNRSPNTAQGGSSSYTYTGLSGVAYASGDAAEDTIRWYFEEVEGGYYITDADGKYLNATYESGTNSGKGDLKVDNTPDVWSLDAGVTLDSGVVNGSYLKSKNASDTATSDKYLGYSTNENLFTVRSESNASEVSIEEATDPIAVESVTVTPEEDTIEVRQTLQLTATVLPTDATSKTVTWTSSDSSIASVDENGLVRGRKEGNVTITAAAGGKSATATIHVTPSTSTEPTYVITVGSHALSTESTTDTLTNNGSGSQRYNYTGLAGADFDPDEVPDDTIRWILEETNTPNGYYIKSLDGRYLNATYSQNSTGGYNGVLKLDNTPDVWVMDGSLDSWEVDGSMLKSSNASETASSDKFLAYEGGSSSNPLNLFTIRSEGNADETTLVPAVDPIAVTSVTVEPSTASVMERKTVQLTATVLPENATHKNVTWTSSDETIAKVDENGLVRGIKAGSVTITATADGQSDTCEITVTPNDNPQTGYIIMIENHALSTDRSPNTAQGGSSSYTYTGLAGVVYSDDTIADNIYWNIEETTGGYYIMSQDGRYLNATYTSGSNSGTGDLKLDEIPDVWVISGTLEDWMIDGSKLKSTNASETATSDKFLGYEEDPANLFTVRSTDNADTSTLIDPSVTIEEKYVETDTLVNGKEYIIAVTKDTDSVYAVKNVATGTTATNTESVSLTVVPATDTEDAYISVTEAEAGVIWKYTNSNYMQNNSMYLNYSSSSSNRVPQSSTSSRAISYNNGYLRFHRSTSGSYYYLSYDNGFTVSSNQNTKVRLFVKTREIVSCDHTYGAPSWSWNSDYTSATATFTCTKCDEQEVVTAEVEPAMGTGEDLGYTVYTATAILGEDTYTDTKKVVNTFTVDDITGTFTYTGYAHEPEVTVKDGDAVLTLDTDYTVAYANNVNAGTATVTVKGKGNYVLAEDVEKTFTIGKGTRNTPEVGHTDETIKGKADGTITGLTIEMQYSTDGGTTYQTVTSDTLTGLAPGTYYVRYKETSNYLASEAATVEIAASTFQVAFSIELNDGIVVRTYVYNVPEGTSPSDYTLKYQYMDEAEGSYTLTKTDTNKTIVATVNAPEMTEPVHVKLLYKGNEIYAKDYTVQDYCETQIRINGENPEMKGMVDLCYALLDYGTFAQERFGVNTDKPANATYTRAAEVLALTIPETLMTEDNTTGDITKVQTSLNLMSKTEMYFYFTPASGVKLSDITFEVQKKGVATSEYTVSKKNGQAIVKVKGIAGPELGDTITVKAKVKGTLSDTVNASPISYLYTAQGVEGLENLSKAVYNYYLKADAYFN